MALAEYQKLTRVLPGRPFGDGSDGAYDSATIPTMVKESCSGSSGSTALTCASTTLSDGDVILLHQSRGTGVGQVEINRVASGGGTTSITLQVNLQFTYTDSGASQAQATVIKRYTDVTVQSGTWTLPDWGGNTGGMLNFACKGTFTQTGAINGNYKGYRGGARSADPPQFGSSGEGGSGQPGSAATGAGVVGNYTAPGGGYGTAGTRGGGIEGTPGQIYGSADLITFSPGGAGAGATANPITSAGAGGDSGGMIIIFAKDIATPTGTASVRGENGDNGAHRGGGAGSGGAILLVCQTATLGTNKFTSLGGTGGTGNSLGGNGGVGRIAVHHSGAVTGTTNPTFDDTEDLTLIETDAAFLFNLM